MKYITPVLCLLIFSACSRSNQRELLIQSPAPQPYAYLTAHNTGAANPLSPDPLISWRWDTVRAGDDLQIYTLKPVKVSSGTPESFENLGSAVKAGTRITVKGRGDLMVDFGQENAAWLEFDSKDLDGKVEMSISEYTEPSVMNTGAQNRIKTKAPVKYGNTYRLELNKELYEGVRYGWIHVRTWSKAWHIDNIRLVCQVKPVNYQGSFSGSDTLLTRIWYTGAYGVKLNLLKDFFGAILMERSDRFAWTGDAHPSQAAALTAFADYDFIRKDIDHTAGQNNGILSYSMYWVLSLADYFMVTGDTLTLVKYIGNASRKLDEAYRHFGTHPALGFYGWDERIGAGFENPGCEESQHAYQMLTLRSMVVFSDLLASVGRKELSKKYRDQAAQKMQELRKNPAWYADFGIHAAADAVNTGLLTSAEKDSLYYRVFRDRLNRLSYSPFNQYFIIQALARMDKYDEAFETIHDCWGGQIAFGGTSFFEVYRPSWNSVLSKNEAPPNNQCGYTSLCHPWGSGVVKWLSEEALGIKPVSPGFRNAEIRPHLGRMLTKVKGEMPTPQGTIQADFDVATGHCSAVIPQGIKATIGIPKVEKEILSVSVNGTKVWPEKQASGPFSSVQEEKDFICFRELAGGRYDFQVVYRGKTPDFRDTEWIYPATFAGEDRSGKDPGSAQHGSDGYIYFNRFIKDGKPSNDISLPSWVKSVSTHLNADSTWAPGIGAIFTRDPEATKQTMTVDIELKEKTSQEIALYFIDWDHKNRRTAVEMFDFDSRRLIAPVRIVRDYAKGVYLTYRYDKSVRFRIDHVRGPNAVLSAIYFKQVK